jgi:hypothetical protein
MNLPLAVILTLSLAKGKDPIARPAADIVLDSSLALRMTNGVVRWQAGRQAGAARNTGGVIAAPPPSDLR